MMAHLGLPFKAVASKYQEAHYKQLPPARLVNFLAENKAAEVAQRYPKAIIIGADTVVACRGKVFHKPKTRQEAYRTLMALSGRVHEVYTGVCVISGEHKLVAAAKTRIYFRKLSPQGIKNYIATGEPMDKAGAYGIQGLGAGLARKVEGDFTNVVGLPLDKTRQLLRRVGVKL